MLEKCNSFAVEVLLLLRPRENNTTSGESHTMYFGGTGRNIGMLSEKFLPWIFRDADPEMKLILLHDNLG